MITRGEKIALGIGVGLGLAYAGLRYALKALAASADRAELIYLDDHRCALHGLRHCTICIPPRHHDPRKVPA